MLGGRGGGVNRGIEDGVDDAAKNERNHTKPYSKHQAMHHPGTPTLSTYHSCYCPQVTNKDTFNDTRKDDL